jgi:hypothetical protein
MNPLFALLSQQSANSAVPSLEYDEQGVLSGIGVNAGVNPPTPPPPPEEYDPYFGNRKDLEARDVADQEIREYRQANPRAGMFGVKGTLRDVLGILGDAFLVQSGNAPLYYPTRQKEALEDKMVGFANNPIAAAERVGGQMGMDLLEAEQGRQLKLAQQQSLADARTSTIETRDYNRLKDARLLAQGILAQPGAYAPDGSLSPDAQGILTTVARQAGVTVQELVGENLSPQALRLLGEAGMTVNQQRNLPIAQQRADASTSQAQSAAVRAARPPAGRAPAQPTKASIENSVREKLNRGEELGEGDQIVADEMRQRAQGRGGGPRRPSRPSATGGLQIRPVRN